MIDWAGKIKNSRIDQFEVGTIWSEGNNLSLITDDFVAATEKLAFDSIACVETKGVVFGAALAERTNRPLLVFRKKGKIINAYEKLSVDFTNWQNRPDRLEIEKDLFTVHRNLLVVDDLAMSLHSFKAVSTIIGLADSKVSAFLCFANASGQKVLDGKPIISLVEPVRP
jgi:adenine phosphoribosyltransferase